MDSLTHIALGACIGELIAGRELGKRAMLVGAIAQSFPDIDFIPALWLHPADNLLVHRGFSHSIIFASAMSPLLAFIAQKWNRKYDIPIETWTLLFISQMLIHLFIDAFNAYGVGWFEPFSHQRISFNTIFVADPVFLIGPLTGFFILLFLRSRNKRRLLWARVGILTSAAYFIFCLSNKLRTDGAAITAFHARHINPKNYFTTPTSFNNLIWYIVAEDDSGFYTGYRSIFDHRTTVDFRYIPKNQWLCKEIQDTATMKKLTRFSKGFYALEKHADTIIYNDLRFGETAGWQKTNAPFTFHYYLAPTGIDNRFVMQQSRFAGWNKETIASFFKRVKGY